MKKQSTTKIDVIIRFNIWEDEVKVMDAFDQGEHTHSKDPHKHTRRIANKILKAVQVAREDLNRVEREAKAYLQVCKKQPRSQ